MAKKKRTEKKRTQNNTADIIKKDVTDEEFTEDNIEETVEEINEVITENTDNINVQESLSSEEVGEIYNDFLDEPTRRGSLEIMQAEELDELDNVEEEEPEISEVEVEEDVFDTGESVNISKEEESETVEVYEQYEVEESGQEDLEEGPEEPMADEEDDGYWVDDEDEDNLDFEENILVGESTECETSDLFPGNDGNGLPSEMSNSDIYETPYNFGDEYKTEIHINPGSSVLAEELEYLTEPDTNEELLGSYKNEDFDVIDLDLKVRKARKKNRIVLLVLLVSVVGSLIFASYRTGITPKTILESVNKVEKPIEKDPETLEELRVISVATINGVELSEADLREYNKIHRFNYLSSMIDGVLLEQYGESMGVKLEVSEVDEAIKRLIENYSSNEEFERTIYEGGTTVEGFRYNIKTNLLRDKIIEKISNDLEIKEEEIRTYFDNSQDEIINISVKYVILNKNNEADTFRKKLAETRDINILLKLFEDNKGSVSEQSGITKYDSIFGEDVATYNVGDIIIKTSDTTDNMILGMVTAKNDTYESLKNSVEGTIRNYRKYQVFESGFNTFRENSEIKYVEVK